MTRDGTVGRTKAARVKELNDLAKVSHSNTYVCVLVCLSDCVWEKNALELTSLTGGTYVCSLGFLNHSHCSILYAAWFRASWMLVVL